MGCRIRFLSFSFVSSMLFSCGESDIIDPNLSGNIGTPDNNILTTVYVALGGLDQIAVFEANSESGALTSIQTVEGIEFPVSLDKDPQGQYMYAAIFGGEGIMGSLEVYKINPDTGFLEQRSSVPVGNLDFHPGFRQETDSINTKSAKISYLRLVFEQLSLRLRRLASLIGYYFDSAFQKSRKILKKVRKKTKIFFGTSIIESLNLAFSFI